MAAIAAASSMGTNASLRRLASRTASQVWATLDARLVGTTKSTASPRITASCASPLISLPTASLGPAVCSTVSWTLALFELSVRLNAAISSASANPEGPTATLSTVGLDQCSQAAPANPPVISNAATTTNQRQVLLMQTSKPAVASQRPRAILSPQPEERVTHDPASSGTPA